MDIITIALGISIIISALMLFRPDLFSWIFRKKGDIRGFYIENVHPFSSCISPNVIITPDGKRGFFRFAKQSISDGKFRVFTDEHERGIPLNLEPGVDWKAKNLFLACFMGGVEIETRVDENGILYSNLPGFDKDEQNTIDVLRKKNALLEIQVADLTAMYERTLGEIEALQRRWKEHTEKIIPKQVIRKAEEGDEGIVIK